MMDHSERFNLNTDNGMFIGPDGCHYDTEAEAMYYGCFDLCGCGSPEDVHKFILECLTATKDNNNTILDCKKIANIVKSKPDVVAEFILHFLDSKGITEHGSSVYGSWLTERGKQVLEIGAMKG